MSKRTLDTFFKPITPPPKKAKPTTSPTTSTTSPFDSPSILSPDTHPSYPIPIAKLPPHLSKSLQTTLPAKPPKHITNTPNLDLLHFQPYIPRNTADDLFTFLRSELPFYRVQYTIKRGGLETRINTPRLTTVFGVDESARFIPRSDLEAPPTTSTHSTSPSPQNQTQTQSQTKDQTPPAIKDLLLTSAQSTPTPKYQYQPRPIPTCLLPLLETVQCATDTKYNFILINYYASGEDSIAFHSDDERFLGPEPTIASLSLGGEREFVMKCKPFSPQQPSQNQPRTQGKGTESGTGKGEPGEVKMAPIKMPLRSGDMVVMRGPTQSNWLHSIPKRKGKNAENIKGRINITFRRALIPGGTNNYYTYNVGSGPVYRWDSKRLEMVLQDQSDK